MCASKCWTTHLAECAPSAVPSDRCPFTVEDSAKDLPQHLRQDQFWTEAATLSGHRTATSHLNSFIGTRNPEDVPGSRTASHAHPFHIDATSHDEVEEQSMNRDCNAIPLADSQSSAGGSHSCDSTQIRRHWVEPHERYPESDSNTFSDFEKRYPPDRPWQELDERARIWRIRQDLVTRSDNDQLERWNKTLDVLLMLALGGTFAASAVYERLNPDAFRAPLSARWIQGMWTFSLLLSLLAVFLAILNKQWIAEYSFRTRAPAANLRYWNLRQTAYNRGLEEWHLGVLISALPVVLVAALFLFMTGLAVFMATQDAIIAFLVVAMTVYMGGFYAAATLAPLWYGNCPSYTPLLGQIRQVFYRIRRLPATDIPVPAYAESSLIEQHKGRYIIEALDWIIDKVPAGDEVNAALDAFGAVDLASHGHHIRGTDTHSLARHHRVSKALNSRCDSAQLGTLEPAAVSRILRTALVINQLPPSFAFHAVSIADTCRTYDIYMMARHILPMDFAFGDHAKVGTLLQDWYHVQRQTTDPCHHRTIDLLAHSPLSTELLTVADATALWLVRMSLQARVALLNRVQHCLEQPENVQKVSSKWSPLPFTADVWLRSIYIFGSLLTCADFEAFKIDRTILISALDMAWREIRPDTKRRDAIYALEFLQANQDNISSLEAEVICALVRAFDGVVSASLRDDTTVNRQVDLGSMFPSFKQAVMKEEVERAWVNPEWRHYGDKWTDEAIATANDSPKHVFTQIFLKSIQIAPPPRSQPASHRLLNTRQVHRGSASSSLSLKYSLSSTAEASTASIEHPQCCRAGVRTLS